MSSRRVIPFSAVIVVGLFLTAGGTDYIWVGGGWHRPPHGGAAWRVPRWRHTERGWSMEHGGWR
jgi:hypothetical protein